MVSTLLTLPRRLARAQQTARTVRQLLSGVLVLACTSGAWAQTPLSGAYTINSVQATGGTNFASFTDAATRLNADGVSGPVTFAVSGGPYNEQIVLNQITGSSATNTVTFNGGGSTIRFASSNTSQRAVVALNGADYVTLNNLNIDATGTGTASTYGWGVLLTNNADYDRVLNCTVTADTNSNNSTDFAGIVVSNAVTTPATSGNTASNLTLEGNTIVGGYYGITLMGGASGALVSGNIVRNNQIRDSFYYGIYSSSQDGALISGNDISRPTRTGAGQYSGIYLTTAGRNVLIEKNRIHDTSNASTTTTAVNYGIYMGTGTSATAGTENTVANNVIYNFTNAGPQNALYNAAASYVRYYHNSVNLSGAVAASTSGTLTTGFYQTTGSNVEFKNNVVVIGRAGTSSRYAIYFSSTATGSTATNYNDLYVPNGNTGYYGAAFATLANWKTANSGIYDQNSVALDPLFASASNLTPNNGAIDNLGTPLATVTSDITGAPRSSTTPDLGAYEFSPTSVDVAAVTLLAPTTTASCYGSAETVTVQISNNAATALDFATAPATVEVVVTLPGGTTQTLTGTVSTGTLASGATLSVTLPGTLNMMALGSYSFAVTATVPGDVTASNNTISPAPTRTVVAPVVGALTPAATTLCLSGSVKLTLAGAANGSIQWQQSTDNTTFTDINGATNPTFTTPIINSTTYYRAQVRCNTNVATSATATITVNNPQLTAANTPVTVCAGSTATLTATAPAGTDVKWYAAATGGTALATGATFTTPVLTTSTQYYAAASIAQTNSVGATDNLFAAGASQNAQQGLIFSVAAPTTLTGVYVYPGTAGNVRVEYQNSAGTLIQGVTLPITTADVGVKTFLPLNFQLQAGTGFRLLVAAPVTTATLFRNEQGATYPYSTADGNVSITGQTFTTTTSNTYYYYFYDWQIASECTGAGARTPVQVNVTPGPVSTFSYAAGTYCAGTTSPSLVAPVLGTGATAGTFAATPAGLTLNATAGIVNLATSVAGTYTVTNTVAASGGSCPASTSTATFTVSPIPTAPFLTVISTNPTVLQSSVITGAQFYLNGVAIPGATGVVYTPTQSGFYTVRITNTSGCASEPSNAVEVGVTSTRKALPGTSLEVYPNPTASGLLTLELHGYRKAAELTVFNALGQVVRTLPLPATTSGKLTQTVDLSALPTGLYTLRVTTEGGVDTRSVVRQ